MLSLAYGPDMMALLGTGNPELVLRNSWDTRSLVGVSCVHTTIRGL